MSDKPPSGPPLEGTAGGDAWERILAKLRLAVDGEYEILRQIGAGGMAAVYLARQVALNRQVAIKVMSPALLTGPGMVDRFRQEARTIAALDHPNIISIYTVRNYEDLHFFVMKFITGRSLEHVIRAVGHLPVIMTRGLLFMIGNALAHAHRRNIIHRDIKPANILIDLDGSAVVTDFGIAKVAENQMLTQTHSGVVIGTPAYMSPEQCYAQPATAASDQYSLGIVAYEMLTGHPPFTGSQFVVMQAHTEKRVPPIRETRPDCPPDLEAAILRMLAKDPHDRWPSMEHAIAAVGAAPLLDGHPARAALASLAGPAHDGPPEGNVPEPYIASVAILAPPEWVEAGDELVLRASARTWSGDTMPGVLIHWESDAPNVAAVGEKDGAVTAIAPGNVVITASVEKVRSSVTLRVFPRRVASITVSIPPGTVHVGDRVQLAARIEDKDHRELRRPVAWVTNNAALAAISEVGVLEGRAPGVALVFAEADGRRGSAEVRIAPAVVAKLRPTTAPTSIAVGARVALGAIALDTSGAPLGERQVVWTAENPAVASITTDGVVTAHAPGDAAFTCSAEGKTARVTLQVDTAASSWGETARPTPGGVGSRTPAAGNAYAASVFAAPEQRMPVPGGPAPADSRIPLKQLGTSNGEPTSRAGVALAARQWTNRAAQAAWRSIDAGVVRGTALVRSHRRITAGAVGAVVLTAVIATLISRRGPEVKIIAAVPIAQPVPIVTTPPDTAKHDSSSVIASGNVGNVEQQSADSIARVIVAPKPGDMQVGSSIDLKAVLRDTAGRRVTGPVEWESSQPSVATVQANGHLEAKHVGRAVVVAKSGSVVDSVRIRVNGDTSVPRAPAQLPAAAFTESTVDAELTRLKSAIEGRRLSAFGLQVSPPDFASELRRTSETPGVQVYYRDRSVEGVEPDGVHATVFFRIRLTDKDKKPVLDFADLKATFERSARGWHLTAVCKRPGC